MLNNAINRKSHRGQTLVEVTLIIPLLIVLVGAALDWGLLFFISHVVQNGVREGVRVAITKTSMTEASIESVVQEKIPDAGLFTDFRSSGHITVGCSTVGTKKVITVTTFGDFSYMFMRILGLTSTTITRSASLYYERLDDCPSIT